MTLFGITLWLFLSLLVARCCAVSHWGRGMSWLARQWATFGPFALWIPFALTTSVQMGPERAWLAYVMAGAGAFILWFVPGPLLGFGRSPNAAGE